MYDFHFPSTTAIVSWDTVSDGKSSWNVALKKFVSMPIVDVSGDVIATDGSDLVGYSSDGTPFGKPIRLFPINGEVFDLTVSLGQYITLLYKCGFIAVYFTST